MNIKNHVPMSKGLGAKQDHPNDPASSATKGAHDLRVKFDRLVKKRKPNKRALTLKIFRELHPRIEEYIDQGMTVAEAREVFNEIARSNVCSRTFGNMLRDERDRIAMGHQVVTDDISGTTKTTSALNDLASTKSTSAESNETNLNIYEQEQRHVSQQSK